VAGTALLGRLTWQLADVVEKIDETPRVRTIVLDAPEWVGHRAGQHLDVRLTAEDGYRAERSYSIASPPGEQVAITVERLDDGEVSPYLADELRHGDQLEIRGPVGGYFVWEPARGGPLLLVAGGSGVVPLMAMIRERERAGADVPTRLLYSSRTYDDVIYKDELDRLAGNGLDVVHTLTRAQPPGWNGYSRRVDRDLLEEVAFPTTESPLAYVCGPTSFVESVADGLVALGYPPQRVKTERFGPTGGR
jgi:ferredoxin-NADP reductase